MSEIIYIEFLREEADERGYYFTETFRNILLEQPIKLAPFEIRLSYFGLLDYSSRNFSSERGHYRLKML